MRSLRGFLASLLLLGCGACLPIPHRHLREPTVTFQVRDRSGKPVPGARVHLYAGVVVGRRVRSAVSAVTDSIGQASFPELHEWHWVYMLAIDGEAPWGWAWCVDAPGYRRAAAGLDDDSPGRIEVWLTRDAGGASCAPSPASLYDVEAEASPGPGA